MTFSFGVGNTIALLELLERIGREIRSYRAAPRHFQELQAALDLIKLPLSHVLPLTPDNGEQSKELEQIRAIALHCALPMPQLIQARGA